MTEQDRWEIDRHRLIERIVKRARDTAPKGAGSGMYGRHYWQGVAIACAEIDLDYTREWSRLAKYVCKDNAFDYESEGG